MVARRFFQALLISAVVSCAAFAPAAVLPGIDVLLAERSDLIAKKRLGLITNRTGVSSSGPTSIDLLAAREDCQLVALFSPEHGIRGEEIAGKKVSDSRDARTGLPIYSLYGKNTRPTAEMLAGIDVLLYDIQDIGCRSYTYLATMGYAMEAALAAKKTFVVLDRPEPMGGQIVDGPLMPGNLLSFVGPYELPWIYGMTPGEAARWIYAHKNLNGELHVVPMKNWRRGMTYAQTGLRWIPPSPNIPRPETALFYAITGGIGELGTFSEGVGTDAPFELIGAPWMDRNDLTEELMKSLVPGVRFEPVTFTPTAYGFKNRTCHGVRIMITDVAVVETSPTMLAIAQAIQRLYATQLPFDQTPASEAEGPARMFDKVFGFRQFRQWINDGRPAEDFLRVWQAQTAAFLPSRARVLNYK